MSPSALEREIDQDGPARRTLRGLWPAASLRHEDVWSRDALSGANGRRATPRRYFVGAISPRAASWPMISLAKPGVSAATDEGFIVSVVADQMG